MTSTKAVQLSKEFLLHLDSELKRDKKMANELLGGVKMLLPRVKERQIYKLLYPFAHHGCYNELRDTVQQYILSPMEQNNYYKLGFPNSLSMYLMTYGANFYPQRDDHRDNLKFSTFGIFKQQVFNNKE